MFLSIAYYIVENDKPVTDTEGLLQSVDKLDAEVGKKYNNTVKRKSLVYRVQNQKPITLLLNSSTDKADIGNLLPVRCTKNSKAEDFFINYCPLVCCW